MPSFSKAAVIASGLLVALCSAQSPAAIYDGNITSDAPVKLNIGNGGAGQSGLIKGMSPMIPNSWHRIRMLIYNC